MKRYKNIIQLIAGLYVIYLGVQLVLQVVQGMIKDQSIIFVGIGILFVILGLVIIWMVYKRYKNSHDI